MYRLRQACRGGSKGCGGNAVVGPYFYQDLGVRQGSGSMDNEYYEPGAGNTADAAHQQTRQIARTRVVGQKERRVDARPLVTGSPVYADEFEQPDMLHARIMHSPHAQVNIRRIE